MRAEKQYLIDEVSGHLKKSDYVILTNFTKLTVADAAELRKRLAPEKAEFHVVKNSSFRVAAKALGLPDLEKSLSGQTAVVVGGKNPAGVAKILKKFIEEKQKLEVKVGVLDKKLMTPPSSRSSPTCPRSTPCARCSSACSPCRARPSSACSTPRSRRSSPLLPPPEPLRLIP
jgi:large subunit ribosomal protein L10